MAPMSRMDKFWTLGGPVLMWLVGFLTCYALHAKGVL